MLTHLLDSLFTWRNRLVADPRFQRWAAAFPLTRGVAQSQSRAVFDLCAGFVYSQVLSAVVSLDLLTILAGGAQNVDDLAKTLNLSPEATSRLLKASTALGLTAERGQNRYGLGMKGAALLGNPGALAMVRHHGMLYADLADPVALLRGEREGTALSAFWPYAKGGDAAPDRVAAYSALMSTSQSLIVEDILEAYPFHIHRSVLDIGGGEGTFLISLAKRHPALNVILFDLPAVAELAETRFASAGLSSRAVAIGGDAFAGPLPETADLITLIRVLHDHDDADVQVLLRNIYTALPPGGTVLIAEPMAGEFATAPMADAYFGFYLLAMGSGRARKPAEYADYLTKIGFSDIRHLRTRRPLMTGAITARRPVENV